MTDSGSTPVPDGTGGMPGRMGGGETRRLDPDAFARLYHTAYPTLWCIAVASLGRSSGADDVCQDAAIIGLRKLGTFVPETSFTAWMGQIVRHVARNATRKAQRRRTMALEDSTGLPSGGAPGGAFPVDSAGRIMHDQDAFDDRLLAALNDLEETPRACIILRTVLGQTYADISRTLAIPEGTAMSHVHRSRRRLRESLHAHSEATP